MNTEAIGAIAIFILLFGSISRRLEKSVITPPMAYVVYGLLISSAALGLVQSVNINNEVIRTLAEITLVLVLFTDASRIQLKLLRREYSLPLRLLGLGLPITIVLGTVMALLLFPSLNIWEAAVLATILTPTDAALGQAVVNSPRVPASIRQAINVESGLNDGICLPVLLLFVALAEETERATDASYWLTFSGKQIVFGVVVGIVVGYLANLLITKSLKRNWMNDSFEDLSVLGISILAYAAADTIGGNGFIAAFCAGLTLGNIAPKSTRQKLYEFGEAEGQLLTLISFLLYGAVTIVPSLSQSNWQMWLYAIGSLTIARIVGVAISTIGSSLQPISVLFIGWFGPRGIASIIYGLVIVEEERLVSSDLIFAVMVVTVLISIFAHGLTAVPGANWYGDRMKEKQNTKEQMPEHKPVPEMAVRLPWRQ